MTLVASLVVGTLVAASPGWLIVPGDAEASSTVAANSVGHALPKSGRGAEVVAVTHSARQCPLGPAKDQASCVLAAAPGARVLVVSGVVLRDRFALSIAVLGKDGAVLAEAADKGALADVDELAVTTLAGLSRALSSREASDAPVAVVLVPGHKDDLVIPQEPPRSRAPAWIATGVTAIAAGVAVTFLAMGLSQKSTLDSAKPGDLRHSEAVELAGRANTDLSVALGTGVGAAAAGVVSGVLWGAGP